MIQGDKLETLIQKRYVQSPRKATPEFQSGDRVKWMKGSQWMSGTVRQTKRNGIQVVADQTGFVGTLSPHFVRKMNKNDAPITGTCIAVLIYIS